MAITEWMIIEGSPHDHPDSLSSALPFCNYPTGIMVLHRFGPQSAPAGLIVQPFSYYTDLLS